MKPQTSPSPGIEEELYCFVANLRVAFQGEPWETVAPYAMRAWKGAGLDEDLDWNAAESEIRRLWA